MPTTTRATPSTHPDPNFDILSQMVLHGRGGAEEEHDALTSLVRGCAAPAPANSTTTPPAPSPCVWESVREAQYRRQLHDVSGGGGRSTGGTSVTGGSFCVSTAASVPSTASGTTSPSSAAAAAARAPWAEPPCQYPDYVSALVSLNAARSPRGQKGPVDLLTAVCDAKAGSKL